MTDKKIKKVSIDLTPVQMVWLHSQHLFQKIQQNSFQDSNEVKFYKNNSGVQVRYQYFNEDSSIDGLLTAKQELQKVIDNNQIRLMNTTLHKDLYIRISKEARKQFPKSYIIFLHYETFENCCRKLNQKFSITSITPQLQRLRKLNPNFCFLIAQKNKIDDIQKFTTRILHTQVSCASTTFSQNISRREQPPVYKKTMSVSSLKGSFSDQNQQQCRLSIHPTVTEEQMFQISQVALDNLNEQEMELIMRNKRYKGCNVYINKFQGNYLNMKKTLYYANRLQLTSTPHMQQIYGYSMTQKNLNRWFLFFIANRKYFSLKDVFRQPWMNCYAKIQILIKIGKALIELHKHQQTYGDLSIKNVLLDSNRNVYLSCFINKDIPPYVNNVIIQTNPFLYDVRQFIMLVYAMFSQIQINYECLMKKIQKQSFFCSLSHKCKNPTIRQFLALADQLFIENVDLQGFVKKSQIIVRST